MSASDQTRRRDPLELPVASAAVHARRIARNRGHVARQRWLTHDLLELVVACVPGSTPIAARAGQFATLRFDGVSHPRSYSFARDPGSEQALEHTFFIRLVPGGELSSWLVASDRTGAPVEITGPLGSLVLDDSSAPMVLIAGGSGISAILALAEEACRRRLPRDCLLLHGVRTQADDFAAADLSRIQAAWDPMHRFDYLTVLSDEPADSAWRGARGLVTDYLEWHLAAWTGYAADTVRTWLCGPPPMVESGQAALRRLGVPDAHVHCDRFEDSSSPHPVIDNRRCVLCDECLLVKPVADCIVEAAVEVGPDGRIAGFRRLVPARSAGLYYNTLVIDGNACIRCYACVKACPHDAITSGSVPPVAILGRASD